MPRVQVTEKAADDGKMEAWLRKRHKHPSTLSGAWGKRWVHINDIRGRLHIGKKQGQEGTTVFSLSEVSEIRQLEPEAKETAGCAFCFRVVQAPLSVVLRCRTEDECSRWVRALERRAELWRHNRREEGQQLGFAYAVTESSQRASGQPLDAATAATAMTGVTGSLYAQAGGMRRSSGGAMAVHGQGGESDGTLDITDNSAQTTPSNSMESLGPVGGMRNFRSSDNDESSDEED